MGNESLSLPTNKRLRRLIGVFAVFLLLDRVGSLSVIRQYLLQNFGTLHWFCANILLFFTWLNHSRWRVVRSIRSCSAAAIHKLSCHPTFMRRIISTKNVFSWTHWLDMAEGWFVNVLRWSSQRNERWKSISWAGESAFSLIKQVDQGSWFHSSMEYMILSKG